VVESTDAPDKSDVYSFYSTTSRSTAQQRQLKRCWAQYTTWYFVTNSCGDDLLRSHIQYCTQQ